MHRNGRPRDRRNTSGNPRCHDDRRRPVARHGHRHPDHGERRLAHRSVRGDPLVGVAYLLVAATVTLPAAALGALAQALVGLTARAEADQKAEITDYLARLPKEVK